MSNQNKKSVSDPGVGGGAPGTRASPVSVQILSFSYSFRRKFGQNNRLIPSLLELPPSPGNPGSANVSLWRCQFSPVLKREKFSPKWCAVNVNRIHWPVRSDYKDRISRRFLYCAYTTDFLKFWKSRWALAILLALAGIAKNGYTNSLAKFST